MKLTVNPNRMELLHLKKRIIFAYRGHKLLKDKQEELMKQFIKLIHGTAILRERIEKEFLDIQEHFVSVCMTTPSEIVNYAASCFAEPKLEIRTVPLMNLKLPKFVIIEPAKWEFIPYLSAELNYALGEFCKLYPQIIKLSENEKAIELIAYELQRTRRRVNALEYVLIPSLKETIKFITDRLNELERSNITRLMKIQELIK